VDSHRLSLYFSSATVVVAASVVAIVLVASFDAGRDGQIDLSRLRGVVLLASAAILAVSLYVALRSLTAARAASREEDAAPGETGATPPDRRSAEGPDEAVLERLSEDERALYDMVLGAGGEMLQMNIVASKVFSKAKVTRTLDKLEDRGLVVRERHGMTNRVRLIR
jgi:uncharacterized membrane protein